MKIMQQMQYAEYSNYANSQLQSLATSPCSRKGAFRAMTMSPVIRGGVLVGQQLPINTASQQSASFAIRAVPFANSQTNPLMLFQIEDTTHTLEASTKAVMPFICSLTVDSSSQKAVDLVAIMFQGQGWGKAL